ncbi:unnamed protein product [Litomosoides sigmodontis]|uniref:Uncharacterized protein n=1 Tax=Litomosoides sigmodontis TaxID=42156 RepID=A0A3P6T2G2_LITSI|nr:unnamed protein product [Litomosoides sigmodontis]
MEASTVGTAVLHEPSSAFDPDREMKDRKLAQIFKKLHMEQDLNTMLDFDNTVSRPTKVSLNHMEELKTNSERCRPRKILDYAVLAKGQGYHNNLVGSFASSYSETGGSSKSGAGCKRIRFQKDRPDDNAATFSVKRRSRCARYASVPKKNGKSRRFSFPSTTNCARKKEASRPRNFACGAKGGILKRRMKDADNIKQAYFISKKVLDSQNQHFKEFMLPEKWIKERKRVRKMKSGEKENTGSASVEDLAMERLVRAFKTAKLLYPEKFAEYFPDFMHCFESDDNKGKGSKKNGVMPKQMHLKAIKNEEDAVTFEKNIALDSGDDLPKRIRKMPKILREYSTGIEIGTKKLVNLKEQVPSVTQKVPRIRGPLAGTSGLRKRRKASTNSAPNQLMVFKSEQNGKAENTKVGDSEELGRISTLKRRRCAKSGFRPNATMKATGVNAAIIQNNIEDSATESSSDESSRMRSSKRQRAQSGFYKTMVTLYDKKRS